MFELFSIGPTGYFAVKQPELIIVKLVLHIRGQKHVTKEMTERQMIALGLIRENKGLTISEMSLKTNVTLQLFKN